MAGERGMGGKYLPCYLNLRRSLLREAKTLSGTFWLSALVTAGPSVDTPPVCRIPTWRDRLRSGLQQLLTLVAPTGSETTEGSS